MEYHTVDPSDSISSIAEKFNTSETQIKSLNNMQTLPPPGSRIVVRAPELTLSTEVYYFTRLGKVKGLLTVTEHVIVFDPFRVGDSCEVIFESGKNIADAGAFQTFIDLSDVIHCNIIELQGTRGSRSTEQMFVIEFMLSRTGREKRGQRSDIPKVNVYFKIANILESGESLQYLSLKTKADQVLALVLSSLASIDRQRADSGTYIPFYEVNKGYLGRMNSGLSEEDDDEEFKELVAEMMAGQDQQQDSLVTPSMQSPSQLLTDKMISQIYTSLPNVFQHRAWDLIYSTYAHGRNLKTFYLKNEKAGPNILIVKDSGGYVFGGYFSNSWRFDTRSYGTGECFVFTFRDTERMKIYYSTLSNECYMMSDHNAIIVGGGGNPSIFLDRFFDTGNSGKSKTFNNLVLSSEPAFQILEVELWGLV